MTRPLLLLFLAGLVIHGLWALSIPVPVDWDPLYYRLVASRILEGEGATIPVVWTLALEPASLPMPADLHWMPLPSRVLLPGLLVWPAHGDQLVTVLLSACLAPLAWALCRQLGWGEATAGLAALLCLAGGGYARFLSTPDSMALFGALATLGWLLAARGSWRGAALVAGLLALTRGDGFLLAPCLALALQGRVPSSRIALVALAGPVAAGLWHLRGLALGGSDYLAARAITANTLDMAAFLRGEDQDPGLGERLAFLVSNLDDSAVTVVIAGVALVPLLALAGGLRERRAGVVRGGALYAGLLLTVPFLLAPAVAASGTLFRSGVALFPLGCVLAARSTLELSAWAVARRGYPPPLLPGLVAAAVVVGSVATGLLTWEARPAPPLDCLALDDLPEGAVVATAEPLAVAALCHRTAVVLPPGLDAAGLERVLRTYEVRLILPASDPSRGLTEAELEDMLPGWGPDGRGRWRSRRVLLPGGASAPL